MRKGWISQDLYDRICRVMPIPCADLAVFFNRKLLLLKRAKGVVDSGSWWIPGGRILKGESSEAAALRECKEETGLEVEVRKLIGVEDYRDHKVHHVSLVYLGKSMSDQVILDCEEHSEYKWVDSGEAVSLLSLPRAQLVRVLFEEVLEV